VPIIHDAVNVGGSIQESAEWDRMHVSDVSRWATLPEIVHSQEQAEDNGLWLASISLGLQLQPEFMLSPWRTS